MPFVVPSFFDDHTGGVPGTLGTLPAYIEWLERELIGARSALRELRGEGFGWLTLPSANGKAEAPAKEERPVVSPVEVPPKAEVPPAPKEEPPAPPGEKSLPELPEGHRESVLKMLQSLAAGPQSMDQMIQLTGLSYSTLLRRVQSYPELVRKVGYHGPYALTDVGEVMLEEMEAEESESGLCTPAGSPSRDT